MAGVGPGNQHNNRTKLGQKKAPVVTLEAATEADQPGMGMTNRVIPAQGEERGASYSLTRLDGDVHRKFQPRDSKYSEVLREAPKRGQQAELTAFCLKKFAAEQVLLSGLGVSPCGGAPRR